jgi:hypothetical protein
MPVRRLNVLPQPGSENAAVRSRFLAGMAAFARLLSIYFKQTTDPRLQPSVDATGFPRWNRTDRCARLLHQFNDTDLHGLCTELADAPHSILTTVVV